MIDMYTFYSQSGFPSWPQRHVKKEKENVAVLRLVRRGKRVRFRQEAGSHRAGDFTGSTAPLA